MSRQKKAGLADEEGLDDSTLSNVVGGVTGTGTARPHDLDPTAHMGPTAPPPDHAPGHVPTPVDGQGTTAHGLGGASGETQEVGAAPGHHQSGPEPRHQMAPPPGPGPHAPAHGPGPHGSGPGPGHHAGPPPEHGDGNSKQTLQGLVQDGPGGGHDTAAKSLLTQLVETGPGGAPTPGNGANISSQTESDPNSNGRGTDLTTSI